jgi:hypothetical protein
LWLIRQFFYAFVNFLHCSVLLPGLIDESYHEYLPPVESPNTMQSADLSNENDVIVNHSDTQPAHLPNGDVNGMETSPMEDSNGDAMTALVNGVNNNGNSHSGSVQDSDSFNGFVVAMHRKMVNFCSKPRWSLKS